MNRGAWKAVILESNTTFPEREQEAVFWAGRVDWSGASAVPVPKEQGRGRQGVDRDCPNEAAANGGADLCGASADQFRARAIEHPGASRGSARDKASAGTRGEVLVEPQRPGRTHHPCSGPG